VFAVSASHRMKDQASAANPTKSNQAPKLVKCITSTITHHSGN
jgi:hypothetical protein